MKYKLCADGEALTEFNDILAFKQARDSQISALAEAILAAEGDKVTLSFESNGAKLSTWAIGLSTWEELKPKGSNITDTQEIAQLVATHYVDRYIDWVDGHWSRWNTED